MTWLARLWRRWRDRHDPAWKPTGIRRTTDGYSYELAKAGWQRAKRQSETGRTLYVPKPKKAKAPVPIAAGRKRA